MLEHLAAADTFSLLIHERMHGLDAASNWFVWSNIKDILGNKDLSTLPYMQDYFTEKQWPPDALRGSTGYDALTEQQQAALATFSSFIPGQSFAEGVAGLGQLYVCGFADFMNAVGPLLDGNGYSSSNSYIRDTVKLIQKYPKAEELYSLYKSMFFEGQEYNSPQLLSDIANGSPQDKQEILDAGFLDIQTTYNIDILNSSSNTFSPDELALIEQSFSIFPNDFFTLPDGERLQVIFSSNMRFPSDAPIIKGDQMFIDRNWLDKHLTDFAGFSVRLSEGIMTLKQDTLGVKLRWRNKKYIGGCWL